MNLLEAISKIARSPSCKAERAPERNVLAYLSTGAQRQHRRWEPAAFLRWLLDRLAKTMLFATVLGSGLLSPSTIEAKSSVTLSYPFEQAWPTALRLLRIDQQYTIVDKDKEGGYIIFEMQHNNKAYRGSMEIARTKDEEGRKSVRLFVHVGKRPIYIESRILKRMESKLREEYGDPVDPQPPPKPKKPPEPKQDRDKPSENEIPILDPNQGSPP